MLRFLLEKEFKQIFRSPFMRGLIVGYPLVVLLILPWATTMEIREIRMCVVDPDRSDYSRRLVNKMAASDYFLQVGNYCDRTEAMAGIASGNADMILEFPPHWSRSLSGGRPVEVAVSVNTIDAVKGSLAAVYTQSIFRDYSSELRRNRGLHTAPPLDIRTQFLYNPHHDYKHFIVPGLIAVVLTMISFILPAMNITNEKEQGTIEQINATPIRSAYFILAKVIPYWVIGFFTLAVCIGIQGIIYNVWPAGNVSILFLFSAVYFICCSGMGLLVANYSSTLQQTMFSVFFVMIVSLLMSGIFTPIESMPDWAQIMAELQPVTHLVRVWRAVILKGAGLTVLVKELLILLGFALFFSFAAVLSYRKQQ